MLTTKTLELENENDCRFPLSGNFELLLPLPPIRFRLSTFDFRLPASDSVRLPNFFIQLSFFLADFLAKTFVVHKIDHSLLLYIILGCILFY